LSSNRTYHTVPVIHDFSSTDRIMILVILTLLPSAGAGIYHYGLHAMFVIGISVLCSVLFEAGYEIARHQDLTIFDFSAVVTGLILGLILPPSVPLYYPVIGAAVAILAGKMLWGGIGRNLVNPAALGKLVLLILFHSTMVDFSTKQYGATTFLTNLMNGEEINLGAMMMGNAPGLIGTGNIITILIGAAVLFLFGVIDIEISLSCLIGFVVFYFFFGEHGMSVYYLAAQIAGGGFLFTAFYMANDYATRPATHRARIVWGVILGVLTGILRRFGALENGALYALVITDLSARFLDEKLMPQPFGARIRPRKVFRFAPHRKDRKQAAEPEPEKLSSDFEDFEDHVVPKGAATGSETAGTIGQDAMEYYNNRTRVDGNPQELPKMPMFGGQNAYSWAGENPQDLNEAAQYLPQQNPMPNGMMGQEMPQEAGPEPSFDGNFYPQDEMPQQVRPAEPVMPQMPPAPEPVPEPAPMQPQMPQPFLDPQTGLYVDPISGFYIDPATGFLIDPMTGLLLDPATGQPIPSGIPQMNAVTDAGLDIPHQVRGQMVQNSDLSSAEQTEIEEGEEAEEEEAHPHRMSASEMEKHLKQRRRELVREAKKNAEAEVVQDDTTRLDVEAIVRAEQEMIANGGEEAQYGSLEFIDLEEPKAKSGEPDGTSETEEPAEESPNDGMEDE
jgi:electron transport complex protein RnfD